MISPTLLTLTSIAQWGLFFGTTSIFFGWIEKRESFVLIGQLVFMALGILALWILLAHVIYVPEIKNGIIPKPLRVITFFKGVGLFAGFNLLSLALKLFKLRFQKASVYFLVLFALALFFMVFNIQQLPN